MIRFKTNTFGNLKKSYFSIELSNTFMNRKPRYFSTIKNTFPDEWLLQFETNEFYNPRQMHCAI